MAFQQRRKSAVGKSVRITGLFRSKTRKGLYVGTARPEEIKALGAKLKEALTEDRGAVFFLWKNEDAEGGPLFSLTADVAQERETKTAAQNRRRVSPDRQAAFDAVNADEPEADDDLPF